MKPGPTACLDDRTDRKGGDEASAEQPDFLPMFPWYSGTSADMYRTVFGLVVSLKLFLGRFDVRTMQVRLPIACDILDQSASYLTNSNWKHRCPSCHATVEAYIPRAVVSSYYVHFCTQAATSAVPPGAGREPPAAGDGFTYEHLAEREEVWLDFMADTGDGGDPTYAVARALAAPWLPIAGTAAGFDASDTGSLPDSDGAATRRS